MARDRHGGVNQDRIRASLHAITTRLDELATTYDKAKVGLDTILSILTDLGDLYAKAEPAERRMLNQALFDRITADNLPLVGFHRPEGGMGRVEVDGEVWVVSGDYKTTPDALSTPFEPVKCHSFITECTFGLPVFKWEDQADVAADLNTWWARNAADGKTSILGAYSLGKAQRLLSMVTPEIGPILTHGAVENTNAVLREQGYALPDTIHVTPELIPKEHPGAVVIAPPSALGSQWARRFGTSSTAFASGVPAVAV